MEIGLLIAPASVGAPSYLSWSGRCGHTTPATGDETARRRARCPLALAARVVVWSSPTPRASASSQQKAEGLLHARELKHLLPAAQSTMLDIEVQKLIQDGKLKIWMDIHINDTRASYQRAVDFVGAKPCMCVAKRARARTHSAVAA